MRIRWLPDARLEMAESVRFYREQAPDLGIALVAEVRGRLDFALRFPEGGTRVPRTKDFHVRSLLLDRFEYVIVYALLDDELLIVAVHHQHRRPGYWKRRLAKTIR